MSNLTVDDFYNEIQHAAQTAAPLFNLYGWTYDEGVVPSANELERVITRLAEHALNHFNDSQEEYPEARVGSGRFNVIVKQYEDEQTLEILLNLAQKSRFKDWTF